MSIFLWYRCRYREKMKAQGIKVSPRPTKVLTRSEREKWRSYWKIKQREHRSKQTSQKRRRKKEKDRKYRSIKRTNRRNVSKCEGNSHNKPTQKWTEAVMRKAVSRMKIPKNPNRFAMAINHLLSKATPRKRKCLAKVLRKPRAVRQLQFENDEATEACKIIMKNVMKHNRSRRIINQQLKDFKKRRLVRQAAKYLGIRHSGVTNAPSPDEPRKRRSDATDDESIQEFYGKPGVSTNIPVSKRIKKDNQERKILDRTVYETYQDFKKENPSSNISFTTFSRRKPQNVETTNKRVWYGCLCEVCTNVELKLRSLTSMSVKLKSDTRLGNKYDAVKKTLCEKEEADRFHKMECVQRKCERCGVEGLVDFYKPLVQTAKLTNEIATYMKWERVTKHKNGKAVTKVMPVRHRKSVGALILELTEETKSLSEHLFVASWQQAQFSQLLKNIPPSWTVLNMDFAENYTCIMQNEVQSGRWGHNQVTVHPTVAYYRCPKEECDKIVQEALIFVTDDMTHDANAVNEFVKLTNQHLKDKRGLQIHHQVQLTDGCSAQYKSKTPFSDISYATEDFGFRIQRHFYGPRHGKGPSDGAGAVAKSAVRRAVMSGDVIVNSASEFFEVAKAKLSKDDSKEEDHLHYKRSFFLVNDIQHDRPDRTNSDTVSGTRKMMCVRSTAKHLELESRNLSCFCDACLSGDESKCTNTKYVEGWTLRKMTVKQNLRGKKNIQKSRGNNKGKRQTRSKTRNKRDSKNAKQTKPVDSTATKKKPRTTRRNEEDTGTTTKGSDAKKSYKLFRQRESTKQRNKERSDGNEKDKLEGLKACIDAEAFETLHCAEIRSFQNTKKQIDIGSRDLVPDDIPLSRDTLYPAVIYGDGNCLPRSASLIAYGTENQHCEMRRRIVREMIMNKEKYLDESTSGKGRNEMGQTNVPKTIASYSSEYKAERLSKNNIAKIFEREIIQISRPGAWMGLWQIAALANVINRPVVSVCPKYGNQNQRQDMHRVFYPFNEEHDEEPAYIMWTNIGGKTYLEKDFVLNHFVVLLPMLSPVKETDDISLLIEEVHDLTDDIFDE